MYYNLSKRSLTSSFSGRTWFSSHTLRSVANVWKKVLLLTSGILQKLAWILKEAVTSPGGGGEGGAGAIIASSKGLKRTEIYIQLVLRAQVPFEKHSRSWN